MKTKRGFTLVELLAVIVILGILALIIVPAISGYIVNTRQETYAAHEKTMKEAAKNHIIDCTMGNKSCSLPSRGDTGEIYLNELIEEELMDKIKNPTTNEDCDYTNSYIIVKNVNDKYEYESCLYCGDYTTSSSNCARKPESQKDKTKPVCGEVTGGSTTWSKDPRTISVKCSDADSGCMRDSFSRTFGDTTTKGTITIRDKARNTTDCQVNVYIDRTEPTCELEVSGGQQESNGWLSGEVTVRFKPNSRYDANSGIATYGIGTSYNTRDYNKKESITFNDETGTTRVFGYVKDNVGNEGYCSLTVRTGIPKPKFDIYYGYQLLPLKENYTTSGLNINESATVTTTSASPKLKFTGMNKYPNVKRIVLITNSSSLPSQESFKVTYGGKTTSAIKTGNRLEFELTQGTYNTYEFTLGNQSGKTIKIERLELEVTTANLITSKPVSVNLRPTTETELVKVDKFSFDSGSSYQSNYYKDFNNTSSDYSSTAYCKNDIGMISDPKTYSVRKIDVVKPTITITSSNTNWINQDITLTAVTTDASGIIGYMWSTNSGITYYDSGWNYFSTPKATHTQTYNVTQNGTYYFYAKDEAGNVYKKDLKVTNVDKAKPTCTNSGDSTVWVAANRTLTYGCKDEAGGSGCNPSYSGGSIVVTETNQQYTVPSYTIKDNAGNTTVCPARTANVYIDKTAPTCGAANGSSTTWVNNTRTVKQECRDTQSGCEKATYDATYSATTQTASVVIKDKVGNQTTCTFNVYVDTTPPTCGAANGSSTTWTASNRTIKQACSDSQAGCTQATFDTTYSTTTKTSSVVIKDKAGNQTTCSYNVYVDKTAPTCGTANGASNSWTNANRTIKQACTDGHSGCAQASYDTTYSSTTQTASVVIKDKVGNQTTCTYNVYVDKTAPTCGTATGASTTWTNANRAISQACSDSQSGCAQAKYDSTYSTTTKTGSVVIKDKAGNQTTCSYNVYVDKTAPTCGTATGASTTWTTSNRTIKQACSDAHSGCGQASYDTTYSTTTKTSSVVIRDKVGNQTTCSYNVYVDKTAPNCGTATGASNSWTNAARTIKQACTDDHSGCAQATYNATYSATTQTASVVIKDNVGNQKTCSFNVYVDTTPPTCGTATGASTTWTNANRAISQACSDSQSGCAQAKYDSTYSTTTKTGSVVIKDKAGNQTTCSYNVYVDKTAPTCGTATGASTTWTTSNRTIKQACSDAHSGCGQASYDTAYSTSTKTGSVVIRDKVGNQTTCSYNVYVDKTAPTCGTATGASTSWTNADRTIKQACSDGHSGCVKTSYDTKYTSSTKTASVVIKDNVGNQTTCTYNVYVDKNAPTCTSSGGNTAWTNGNRTLTGTCADTGGSGCTGNVTKTYSSNINSTKESPGTVKDAAGNSTVCPANQTVRIDKTAPTCTSSGGNTAWTNGNRTLTGTCSDSGGSGCSNVTKTYSSNINSTKESPGTVKDGAGNTAVCPANQTVRIDKTAPTCTSSGGNTAWTNGNRTLTGTCADTGGSGCTGNVTKTYSSNINSTTETPGVVKDNAGNQVTCPSNQTVRIDKTPPTCTSSGGNSAWTNGNVTLTGTCSDTGGSGCAGNVTKPFTGNTNTTTASPGAVRDNAGNTVNCPGNQTVKIDKTPPTCRVEKYGTYLPEGVSAYVYCDDTGGSECATPHRTDLRGNTKSTSYTIRDNAGNQTACPITVNSGSQRGYGHCMNARSCENPAFGTYICNCTHCSGYSCRNVSCKRWTIKYSCITSTGYQRNGTLNVSASSYYEAESRCSQAFSRCCSDQVGSCTPKRCEISCEQGSCQTCNRSGTSVDICGCETYSSPSSWASVSSCTEGVDPNSNDRYIYCRTVYY